MANKKLRVCLSSELPDILQRSSDYLYFTYDNLGLYSGQNRLTDNFAIANTMPTEPVNGMIYILDKDGSVHRYIDHKDTTSATIESSSQIDLLKKAGTMFYVNSANRYFDSQRRTLQLPFNNGTYEMVVSMKNNQIFDNNTIAKYNVDHERFEIYGDQDEEFIDFSKPFRGSETNSLKTTVDGPRISGNVKISNVKDNMLRAASDGLMVNGQSKVDIDVFNEWASSVAELRGYAESVMENVESALKDVESIVTEESIRQEVMDILESKYSDIDTAIRNYAEIVDKIDTLESSLLTYISATFANTQEDIISEYEKMSSWDDLDSSTESITEEIDYYKKSEEYLNPELTEDELQVLLQAAVYSYIESENESKGE